MEKDERFINFYTGSEIMIMGLRKRLEAVGIFGMMQNDFNSGNLAGFVGGSPNTVRFKIRAIDVKKAQPILDEFLNANSTD